VSGAPLVPFNSTNIRDLYDLREAVHASADMGYSDSTLHFEADTVHDIADGLVNLLKYCHARLTGRDASGSDLLNFTNPTSSSTFSIYRQAGPDLRNHDLTISDMKSAFSMPSWIFRA
jgi:hypothetical protein